jgi:hypothetical protein
MPAQLIEYPSRNFMKECDQAIEAWSAFGVRIRKPGRKTKAIRRTLMALADSEVPYPIYLALLDKIRLMNLWIGISGALAARWRFAYYEDELGFEIYLTPRA